MKIYVRNRYWVEFQLKENRDLLDAWSMISIYSSGDICPIKEERDTLLKMQFDDIIMPTDGMILFTDEMAREIKRFANYLIAKYPNRPLIVHCDAGVSRSGAVGAALNEYVNLRVMNNRRHYDWFIREHVNLISPNQAVMSRMMKVVLEG